MGSFRFQTQEMNSDVKFSNAPWDEENKVSALHLSFLVQTLLPLHTIQWDETKRHYVSITEDINEKFAKDDVLQCIATGSMAEGYSIPSSVLKNSSPPEPELRNEILSDVDILCVISRLKMCTDENLLTDELVNEEYKGYFEYIKESPGYVRICLLNPKAEDDIFVVDPVSGKYFLSGTKFTDKLYNVISERESVTKQGPAITLVDELAASKLKLKEGLSVDMVMALSGYPWPTISGGWTERIEHSEWLTDDIVDCIIKDGCHVVAVPSKQSSTPDLEWRLSFSASEGKLAREVVTDYQRQCFIYVKILHHQKVKPLGIISSYMFKSVFLHCCERLPVSHWKDYPGSCILYILDVVIDCLRRKHVPTFFLPENNLISHITDDEIQETMVMIESVRKDPITPILEFTDKGIFSRQSVYIPFRKMVAHLLDDMREFENHKTPEKTILNGFSQTGYEICLFYLAEQFSDGREALFKYKEGVRHLINLYNFWLKPINQPPNSKLETFINGSGLAIRNPVRALRFFEAAISLSNEFPEFLSLRGNLASLYHGASYFTSLSQEKRETYLTKAEILFRAQHDECNTSTGFANVDYIAFLVKQNRLETARNLIESFLSGNDSSKKMYYSYDLKEKDCLVEPLKQHVEINGKIAGDAVSFAFFFLAYCFKYDTCADVKENLKHTLIRFGEHYTDNSDSNSKVLLNYAKLFEE